MAGHSHSANIALRKGAQDKKRGKLFTKLVKEIMVAVKVGGADTDSNPRLRLAIQKARSNSMPKANIERAVAKASGSLDGANYEVLSMEGYAAGGVAVLCEVLTDNRNRAASEIRYAYAKNGGNLGTAGCVSYMFQRRGVLVVESQNEDEVMMVSLDAGAEDVVELEGGFEVLTAPDDFEAVCKAMEEANLVTASAEVAMIADTRIALTGKAAEQLLRLVEDLEDCEDVQQVHHNGEVAEDELENLIG